MTIEIKTLRTREEIENAIAARSLAAAARRTEEIKTIVMRSIARSQRTITHIRSTP
jgi:hypothetical protein